jgi:acyl-coenzyme A synthetase/AMP-(fatty) acid ligase
MGLKCILNACEPKGLEGESLQIIRQTREMIDIDSPPLIRETSDETDAYVLFTSGSTGHPKGVRINRRNIDAFHRAYLAFGPEYSNSDRFLQIYDISFDGSVPCYLVALCTGASVFTVPQDEIKYLYAFKLMKEQELTVVKMTPSTLYYLQPFFLTIQLPKVRVCLFGGEALRVSIVEEWMNCVPNALIQNVYGPTEATIDSLMYNYNSGKFQKKSEDGIISLGNGFGDFEYAVIDNEGAQVSKGEKGELCLGGDQVMSAYWKDEEKSTQAFIFLETTNGEKRFYRTGDMVSRDADGFFMFHGRIDCQVQVQGYRVELEEIEKHATDASGEHSVAAIPVTNKNGNTEIVLFIGREEQLQDMILSEMHKKLPHYMIPSRIIFRNELPRLNNGKTDRKKLSEIAQQNEKH